MGKKKKDKKAKKARKREARVAAPAAPPPGPKRMISFRVDPDVLDFFKAGGPGYQTRMHAVLRAYMEGRRP